MNLSHHLPPRHQLTVISPFRGSKPRHQRTLNQAVLKTKPSPQPQSAHALKRDGELVVDGSDTTHSAAHGSSPSPKIVAPSWARELATTPCYLDYLVYVLGIRRSQLRGRLGRRRILEKRLDMLLLRTEQVGTRYSVGGLADGPSCASRPGLVLLVLARVFHPGDCRPD